MLEPLSWTYNNILWLLHRVSAVEKDSLAAFTDKGTLLSGAIAGGVGRAMVLPLDRGGSKGMMQTVLRRMPQMGLLMMFYCPVAADILPGLERNPSSKMLTTFVIAACAGFNMRLLTNPISRVADECLRTGKRPLDVARTLKNKTILQFWYVGPNLFANALYFGVLLTVFEGLRRYTERNFLSYQTSTAMAAASSAKGEHTAEGADGELSVTGTTYNEKKYYRTAATHCVLGGVSAAVSSTLCYPYSAHRYLQTVIHDSALCRGLVPTLLKEVPFIAATFGTFSLLQPIFSRQHGVRCGFGY